MLHNLIFDGPHVHTHTRTHMYLDIGEASANERTARRLPARDARTRSTRRVRDGGRHGHPLGSQHCAINRQLQHGETSGIIGRVSS